MAEATTGIFKQKWLIWVIVGIIIIVAIIIFANQAKASEISANTQSKNEDDVEDADDNLSLETGLDALGNALSAQDKEEIRKRIECRRTCRTLCKTRPIISFTGNSRRKCRRKCKRDCAKYGLDYVKANY